MAPACRLIPKVLLPSLLPGPQDPFTPCPHLFRPYFSHFISQAANMRQNRNLSALEGWAGTGQGEKPELHNSLVLSSSFHLEFLCLFPLHLSWSPVILWPWGS